MSLEAFPNFIIVDDQGIIVYINEIYSKMLGISQADAIGKPVKDIIPNTRMDTVVKTGVAEIGSVMKFYNHEEKRENTLICNRIPILKDGKVLGAVAITTLNNLSEIEILSNEIERVREENRKIDAELARLKQSLSPLKDIIGSSKAITEIKKSISDYAKSNLPILITGETGVGKEVFANSIHQLSNRSQNNYVKVNCAAIPHDLLESELFGYAEGAFSGAVKGGKIGKFELANHGTILLDEIGEMPLALQSKLLRVLQENEVERVGGTKPLKLDIRVICSTNSDIEALIEKKRFREDLYYRINVVKLTIPPLRLHKSDIQTLCAHFSDRVNQEEQTRITGISSEVLEMFQGHDWPGNVRELEHVVYRASVLRQKGMIEMTHCVFFLDKKAVNLPMDTPDSLKGLTNEVEKKSIISALHATSGNKTKAAQLLKMDRSLLYSKIRKYNIE